VDPSVVPHFRILVEPGDFAIGAIPLLAYPEHAVGVLVGDLRVDDCVENGEGGRRETQGYAEGSNGDGHEAGAPPE
jgi:hypothetical protein